MSKPKVSTETHVPFETMIPNFWKKSKTRIFDLIVLVNLAEGAEEAGEMSCRSWSSSAHHHRRRHKAALGGQTSELNSKHSRWADGHHASNQV